MNKTISTTVGILIVFLVAGIAGASVLFSIQKDDVIFVPEEKVAEEIQYKEGNTIGQEEVIMTTVDGEDSTKAGGSLYISDYGYQFRYPGEASIVSRPHTEENLNSISIENIPIETETYDWTPEYEEKFGKEVFKIYHNVRENKNKISFSELKNELEKSSPYHGEAGELMIDDKRVLTFNWTQGVFGESYYVFFGNYILQFHYNVGLPGDVDDKIKQHRVHLKNIIKSLQPVNGN